MSALQNQYISCHKFYSSYKNQYLFKDINEWEVRNQYYFNFTANDLADIKSELKCLLLADIHEKYKNNIPIYHPRNYVFSVCKNDLKNALIKRSRLRKNRKQFEKEWKLKMIDAKNRKNDNLLTILDQYTYEEVREVFRSALDIREMAIVYLVHSGFSYLTISKALKISAEYCRKIYNRAENKLKKALGLA